jgi:hypothetical protein
VASAHPAIAPHSVSPANAPAPAAANATARSARAPGTGRPASTAPAHATAPATREAPAIEFTSIQGSSRTYPRGASRGRDNAPLTFIETIPPEQATGALAELYDEERADDGYVTNATRAFSHRPDVRSGWERFVSSIAANMDSRRYELATLAAARRLRSSYCMLAHGSVTLKKQLLEPDVREVLTVGRPIAER